jgi:hypothetical protein
MCKDRPFQAADEICPSSILLSAEVSECYFIYFGKSHAFDSVFSRCVSRPLGSHSCFIFKPCIDYEICPSSILLSAEVSECYFIYGCKGKWFQFSDKEG